MFKKLLRAFGLIVDKLQTNINKGIRKSKTSNVETVSIFKMEKFQAL